MPVNHGGIWCGAKDPPPSPQLLGATPDGGAGGGVLPRTLPRREMLYLERPTAAHHLQCGCGSSGITLGIIGGRKTGEGGQQ